MTIFKEIIYYQTEKSKIIDNKDVCPKCNHYLEYGKIPCPDNQKECSTIHNGYRCTNCKSYFQKEN